MLLYASVAVNIIKRGECVESKQTLSYDRYKNIYIMNAVYVIQDHYLYATRHANTFLY